MYYAYAPRLDREVGAHRGALDATHLEHLECTALSSRSSSTPLYILFKRTRHSRLTRGHCGRRRLD